MPRPKRKHLKPIERWAISRAYLAGVGVKIIMHDHNCCSSTITNVVRSYGIAVRKPRGPCPRQSKPPVAPPLQDVNDTP